VQAAATAVGTPAAPAGASGLDLLRGPAGEETPAAEPTEMQKVQQMTAQGDAINKSMVGMLESISPMLSNPAITKGMNPQQKADFDELNKMLQDLKTGIASNTITTPQEQQAKMLKIQQLVMRMLSTGLAMPKPGLAPPPQGTKK
jgi:hypothetical protein